MNVYQVVTERILAALSEGVAPWVRPWTGSPKDALPYNARTHRRYSGVNVLLLWGAALDRGYSQPAWLTFVQAKELGAHVRKGERAEHIVFASTYQKKRDGAEDGAEEKIRFLKFHAVFNVTQVEGLPAEMYNTPQPRPLDESLLEAHGFLRALGADVQHGGAMAAYSPTTDRIVLPERERFESDAHYVATSIHEHGHWSGHKSRLDRDLSGRFGSEAYAAEELVAELTAAYLCAHLQVPGALRHPEYIGSWLKVLGNDHRAIFTAASKATEAAEFLRGIAEPAQEALEEAG